MTSLVRLLRAPARRSRWTSILLLLTALAAAGSALLLTGGGAADAAGSCTIYWTGATNTAWTTTTNWSLTDGGGSAGRIPAATDVACMSTSPTRSTVVLSASKTVAGIVFADTSTVHPGLEVASGTLTVGTAANGAVASTINNLKLDNSTTLAGTAGVTATGSGTAIGSSTTATGASTLTLSPNTAVTLDGFSLTAKRRLVNQGTVTQPGQVTLTNVSIIENAGSYTLNTTSGYIYPSDSTANALINDAGATFTSAEAGGYLPLDVPLTNNGSVAVTAGDLYLDKGASGSGSYAIASGSTLHANGGTLALVGNMFSGAGTFAIDNGTVTGSATVPNLALNGGTLDGAGTLTVSGTGALKSVSLNHGYRLVNSGTLTTPVCQYCTFLGLS